jgi:hypothetical protein
MSLVLDTFLSNNKVSLQKPVGGANLIFCLAMPLTLAAHKGNAGRTTGSLRWPSLKRSGRVRACVLLHGVRGLTKRLQEVPRVRHSCQSEDQRQVQGLGCGMRTKGAEDSVSAAARASVGLAWVSKYLCPNHDRWLSASVWAARPRDWPEFVGSSPGRRCIIRSPCHSDGSPWRIPNTSRSLRKEQTPGAIGGRKILRSGQI